MSDKNGAETETRKELAQHQSEEQRKNQAHQANLATQTEIEKEKAAYLEKLTETGMSDAGINLLDNMLDRSFVLGNITEAEYHDIKWQMHAMYLKIKSNFPKKESCATGDMRAFILDDETEALEPLTGKQKTIIAQMIRGITMLVSRSKGGFQQEMLIKSISVSEVMDESGDDDDGSLLGLFS